MKRPSTSSLALIALSGVLFFLTACGPAVADDLQYWVDVWTKDNVGKQMKTYIDNQPIPYFDYSAPRDTVEQLYRATIPEMKPIWIVTFDYQGPYEVCHGLGVPIPYGVQLTSPEYRSDTVTMPLSEPTGLYTNGVTTDATWLFCDYGHGLEPVYDETMVKAFFHPVHLEWSDKTQRYEIIHEDAKPSITIDVKKGS